MDSLGWGWEVPDSSRKWENPRGRKKDRETERKWKETKADETDPWQEPDGMAISSKPKEASSSSPLSRVWKFLG
jgi:hypothetical protein